MTFSDSECRMILAIARVCYICEEVHDDEKHLSGLECQECGCWYHGRGCGSTYRNGSFKRVRVVNHKFHEVENCKHIEQEQLVANYLEKNFGCDDPKAALRAFVQVHCPNFGASHEDYVACEMEVRRLQKEVEKLHREKLASWSSDHVGMDNKIDIVMQKIHEMNKLMKDNQDLVMKCERALATARSKSVQLETVTREIAQLKEEYKTLQKDVPEELVAQKQKQFGDPDWHSSDDALLNTQWNEFRTKFNTLHKNVKDILQSSVSAKDASVLCANLRNVRQLTEVAETVREELMKTTEDCTEKFANILDRILPASLSTTEQESRPSDAQFLE